MTSHSENGVAPDNRPDEPMAEPSASAREMQPEQKNYLQGFVMGSDVARAVRGLPVLSGSGNPGTTISVGGAAASGATVAGPDAIHFEAQNRFVSEGKQLSKEEEAKRGKNAMDMWNEMRANAAAGVFPKGTDVFLYKFHGMFHVAPAQDSFMCRMRIPGGILRSHQFRGIADLSDRFAGGYVDVTTRANLQIREIAPENPLNVLTGLMDLGVVIRGSGGDNIRNVTASPLSGIDPGELIETHTLAGEMHHFILNHREMYGLPRKFNIAFDGGGTISSLDDTNDIGFHAVEVTSDQATEDVAAGIYFDFRLGGITGHLDFARSTQILLKPEECIAVAEAVVQVFIAKGDRTDRKKARLKYVLDDLGIDAFVAEVEKLLPFPLRRFPVERLAVRSVEQRNAHVGFHPQRQPGRQYVGVVLPVGRMTSKQVRALSDIADRFGSGTIRLTVWQNLIISDIEDGQIEAVKAAIEQCGLEHSASSVRSGLVACTGSAGCKFAAADTKGQALILAEFLERHVDLDQPVNIHLTGCHHSCAQHYIGDIGLLATQVEQDDEEMVEGYHVFVGGGWGERRGVGRKLFDSVAFGDLPPIVEKLLSGYLAHRDSPEEAFSSFARRHDEDQLRELVNAGAPNAA